MSGFQILDLVIGMIFIYFLLSIISSSAVEMVLTIKKIRARVLQKWLYTLFNKPVTQADGSTISLGEAIMNHCSVTALSVPGKSPSYIDAKNFASALLEKITFDPGNQKTIPATMDGLIEQLKNADMLSTEFQRVLIAYAIEAKDTYASVTQKTASEYQIFRAKLETWYDSSMDRLTGYLKTHYTRQITIGVAIVTTLLLNADSIAIAKFLYSNPEVRTTLAAQANEATKDSVNQLTMRIDEMKALHDSATIEEVKATMKNGLDNIAEAKSVLQATIPLGWNGRVFTNEEGRFSILAVLSKIVGLAATVLAIVMGAPFWFDMLSKVSNIRNAGPKPASRTGVETGDSKNILSIIVNAKKFSLFIQSIHFSFFGKKRKMRRK